MKDDDEYTLPAAVVFFVTWPAQLFILVALLTVTIRDVWDDPTIAQDLEEGEESEYFKYIHSVIEENEAWLVPAVTLLGWAAVLGPFLI